MSDNTDYYKGPDIALFKDAESYDTFDARSLDDALHEIKLDSFNFLYNTQLEAVNHSRFDLTMSDFKTESVFKRVAPIDGSFIAEDRRLMYKKSSFKNKDLSPFDIANNSNIFSRTFIVFIDGQFYDNIKIRCIEDKTLLVITLTNGVSPDGMPTTHYENLVAMDSKVTVFFMPNCAYGTYNTNRNVLLKYKDNLALSRFNIANELGSESSYTTFINSNDFLFSGVVTNTVQSAGMLRFSNVNLNNFQSRYIHLNIFGFRNLYDQIDIEEGQTFFTIPAQDMPVPVENIIFFTNLNGIKYLAHDVSAKMYYPNHYEILNNVDDLELTAYVFYFKDTSGVSTEKYRSVIELYNSVFPLTALDYQNDTVPQIIRDYVPEDYTYSLRDFDEYANFPRHLQYKVDKMREWIVKDPNLLRVYIGRQIEKNKAYVLDCSSVDLPSKYRLNNHAEVVYEGDKVTFDEPHYLFVLRRYYGLDAMFYRFFINDRMFVPRYMCKDDYYEYHYLPVSLITSTTLIEIERFDTYEFSANVTFTEVDDKQTISFESAPKLNVNCISLVNSQTYEFIPRSSYTISAVIDSHEIVFSEESNKIIPNTFNVTLTDEDLVDVQVIVYAKQHFYVLTKKISTIEDVYAPFIFTSTFENDKRHIRVFRNGKLIPHSLMIFAFSNKVGGTNTIYPLLTLEIGDVITVDHTPYKYSEMHTALTIPETGLVDLKGIVDKPFDLKWFDVYLNGNKLNRQHIDILTPTIIIIKNVQTLKNFRIMQKNRGTEYFTFDSDTDLTVEDILWESIPELKDAIMDGRPILDDIEDDIMDVIVDMVDIEKGILFSAMAGINKFINPDINQIPDYLIATLPTVFNGGTVAQLYPIVTGTHRPLKIFPSID